MSAQSHIRTLKHKVAKAKRRAERFHKLGQTSAALAEENRAKRIAGTLLAIGTSSGSGRGGFGGRGRSETTRVIAHVSGISTYKKCLLRVVGPPWRVTTKKADEHAELRAAKARKLADLGGKTHETAEAVA